MDQKICATPITGNYVAHHMKQNLGPHAILESVEGEKIAIGQGFGSNILRLKLNWATDGKDDLPETVIVKAPTVEALHKLMDGTLEGKEEEKLKDAMSKAIPIAHNAECRIYRTFGNKPPVLMPKYFVALEVTQEPGMLILEDMSISSSIPPSMLKGLTYHQAMEAVTQVGRLQGWCLTTSKDWQSQLQSLEQQKEMMKNFIFSVPSALQVVKAKYPDHFGDIDVEKLSKFFTWDGFLGMMTEHREIMDDVLVHGDFHMNNILYEKNSDGSVSDRLTALIDFQGVQKGSPAYDVARLFSFSISPELRRERGDEIVRRYYDEVKSIAGDKFKATFEEIHHLWKRLFALEAIFLVAWIPAMVSLMVKSDSENKEKDTEAVFAKIKATFKDAMEIFGIA